MTQQEIQQKYYKERPELTEGCWFLCSKPQFVSKTIRSCDKNADGSWARFSHIAKVITKEVNGKIRFMVIDSNAKGVDAHLLSLVVKECDDILFIKPLVSDVVINNSLEKLFDRAEKGIKYDFNNGSKELLNRRYGWNLKTTLRDMHDICSDFINQDLKDCNAVTDDFHKKQLTLPQDAVRYRNIHTTKIIGVSTNM